MKEREAGSQSGGISSRPGAPQPQWQSGYLWRCRHLHVPVIVWIAASVLGGAAIGSALEPDGKSDTQPPATEVVVDEPVSAVNCDENYGSCVPVASDVDCLSTEVDINSDVDGPAFRSGSVEVVGDDVYGLDADANGIACD